MRPCFLSGPLFFALAAIAPAQLKVAQFYHGVNRPLTVQVQAPRGAKALSVVLLTPMGEERRASIRPGRQDLARVLDLWAKPVPKVTYAQLYADGKPIGSPLVLQPMTSPPLSRLAADGKTVEFVPDEDQAFAGIRAYEDRYLELDTSAGPMVFALRPDAAPNTAFNIRQFAEGGLYTDTVWHRVVLRRQDGSRFVIQGGDPSGTGSGGPGFAYALEKSPLEHRFGVVSIARSTDPNTNGCQLFVALSREGTKHLDGRYAAFGELIRGAEAVAKIATVPGGRPIAP